MTLLRMDHVGVIVSDLDEALAFFAALGFKIGGRMTLGDERVDRIVGLNGVRNTMAMIETPDGHSRLEVIQFLSPAVREGDAGAPANTLGLRHLCFAVDSLEDTLARLDAELVGEIVDYGGSFKLCYLRGPDGIIVELAEKLS